MVSVAGVKAPRLSLWRAQRDKSREQARLGVGESEEHVCSGGYPDPDHRAATQLGNHSSDVLGVVFDMIGSRQSEAPDPRGLIVTIRNSWQSCSRIGWIVASP
jgi:hypothetical protein